MDGVAPQSRLALDGEQALFDGEVNRALPLSDEVRDPQVRTAQGPGDAGELIEPGRALVLSDLNPPEISAAERFVRFAYRLGIPGATLSAPFRKPAKLRLLATVETPLAGDRVAGVGLRAGHFLVHGAKQPIAGLDFAPAARLTPPFERAVHDIRLAARSRGERAARTMHIHRRVDPRDAGSTPIRCPVRAPPGRLAMRATAC